MGTAHRGWRLALAGLALLAVTACSDVVRHHGFTPADEELAAITVGKDTRATVSTKIGPPSAGGIMADGGWYYVQSRWVQRGALAPREVDRQVVAISFDRSDRVSNIERFGLAEGQVVPLSRRVTESNVKGIGIIQQMMGNLGRFDPGQFLK